MVSGAWHPLLPLRYQEALFIPTDEGNEYANLHFANALNGKVSIYGGLSLFGVERGVERFVLRKGISALHSRFKRAKTYVFSQFPPACAIFNAYSILIHSLLQAILQD